MSMIDLDTAATIAQRWSDTEEGKGYREIHPYGREDADGSVILMSSTTPAGDMPLGAGSCGVRVTADGLVELLPPSGGAVARLMSLPLVGDWPPEQ